MPTPCPGCNKFPSLTADDVEVDDLEINEDGVVTGTAHFVLNSECCGENMKEHTFDIDTQPDLDGKFKTTHFEKVDVGNACVHCGADEDAHINGLCPWTTEDLDVEGEAVVDECKVKGKKAYKLDLTITISGNALTAPVEMSYEDTVLQADMEDMC